MVDQTGDIRSIDQVAVVVRDIEAAMRHDAERVGIGPRSVDTYGPHRMQTVTYRGEERYDVMTLALAHAGATMGELIEPVEGPNGYEGVLALGGEGLHHLDDDVDDIDAEIAAMAAQDYALLQGGRGFNVDGDGPYDDFDTERDLGCIVEAMALPRAMPPPERVHPEPMA